MNYLKNKLKIQYVSDIHLEFLGAREVEAAAMRIVPKAPVLVLAGDIGIAGTPEHAKFLASVSQKFEHTFFIHGNHEYYGEDRCPGTYTDNGKPTSTYAGACLSSKSLETTKLHFLNNTTYDLDRWRFIGSTLWSRIDDKEYQINDSGRIPWFFSEYCNYMHARSKSWIKDEIEKSVKDGLVPIVVTHHLPSFKLVDEKYRRYSKFNQCFASHSDALIADSVAAWIYGHTHSQSSTLWNGRKTQVVCNPIGYPGEREERTIDYGATIEVDAPVHLP